MSNQAARQRIKELLALSNAVILDTESTGLGNDDEVVQVAVIGLDGHVYYDSLVKPTRAISMEAEAVHGITNEMVADAKPFREHDYLLGLLTGATILTYNVQFDRRILSQSCYANSIGDPFYAYKWECIMELYARIWGEFNRRYGTYKWQSLEKACRQQGVPYEDGHTALGDCLATLALMRKVANG